MAYGPCQTSSTLPHPTPGATGTPASIPATAITTIHSSHLPIASIISLKCPTTHSIAIIIIIITISSQIHSCYSIQFSVISVNISWTSSNHARDLIYAIGVMTRLALGSRLALTVWEGCYVAWACPLICSRLSQLRTLGLDRGADVLDGDRRAGLQQPSTVSLHTVNGHA